MIYEFFLSNDWTWQTRNSRHHLPAENIHPNVLDNPILGAREVIIDGSNLF